MSRARTIILLFVLTVCFCNTKALAEKPAETRGATVEAKVMAPPQITYQALRSMRDEDPSGCRVLSATNDESVIEEIFDGLPLIGKAVCVYRETYEPGKKVSFKMIRSDKLKAFEGAWTLEATDNDKHTLVKLRSYIDTGLKVPLAGQLTQMASTNELRQQLADLKKSAELKQKKLSEKKKNEAL